MRVPEVLSSDIVIWLVKARKLKTPVTNNSMVICGEEKAHEEKNIAGCSSHDLSRCRARRGTLAYFTSENTAHNVITSGGVNIEVVEKTQGKDGVLVDFPKEGVRGVMPGSDVSKIVSVKNTGESEAGYVFK